MAAEAAIALLAKAPKVEAKTDEQKPNASTYEQRRLAAADLAAPGGSERSQASGSKINRDAIFAARRNAPKGA